MRFLAETSTDGVREQRFQLDELPGVLWTPDQTSGPLPLILLGHGGGEHKLTPAVRDRARRYVSGGGFAAVAVDVPGHGDRPVDETFNSLAERNQARIDSGEDRAVLIAEFQALVAQRTVPEWRSVVDAVQKLDHVGAGPVGYWGVTLGCGLGVPFVAAESRVRAAVLGLGGAHASGEPAAAITVPVLFEVQWDDERVPREQALALYDAFASAGKTLHANPGKHGELPAHEVDDELAFFRRHLN